jgi:hypothetical protein
MYGRASAECGRALLECSPMMFSGCEKVLGCKEPESHDMKCEVVLGKAEEDGIVEIWIACKCVVCYMWQARPKKDGSRRRERQDESN